MFRKSYHEYLFSMQDENDPIAKYIKHREEMLMSVSQEGAKEQQKQLDATSAHPLDKEINQKMKTNNNIGTIT